MIYIPIALNLTNRRFGSLIVVSKVKSRNGKTYWLCQCDCGNQKEVQTSHLMSGAIKSCGCQFDPIKNFGETEREKQCPICKEYFLPNNAMRKYCFNCIPNGLSSKERIHHFDHLIKHKLVQYKGGKCEKCGYNKCEGALHFHHLNPEEKEFTISNINFGNEFDMEKLYQEVDKCSILCANCHAEEHYKEL